MPELRMGLLAAGISAMAFLSGQLLAWRQLTGEGYLLAANPANAFFYVLTGVHGLHLLGGLVALGRTTEKAWRETTTEPLRLSVELCATYWHFLLLVWLVFLSVLTGWAGEFVDICRQLLT
jgi:cytochrome c oxidase subunit 3